jgi:hypothetical protein
VELNNIKLWQPYAYIQNGHITNYYVYTKRVSNGLYYLVYEVAGKTYFSSSFRQILNREAKINFAKDTRPMVPIKKEFIRIIFEYNKEEE